MKYIHLRRRRLGLPVPICLEWIVPPLPFRKRISLLEADKLVQVEQSIEENAAHLQSLRLQEVLRKHMGMISLQSSRKTKHQLLGFPFEAQEESNISRLRF